VINQTESMMNKKIKIIKRYQNRKLYDTQQSCYVTLDDIAKMIRSSEEVMVIDNKSKNDITAATLTQIIFEAEKKASQYAPLFTLREIIQNGNGSISSYLAKLGAFPQEYIVQQAHAQAQMQAAQMEEKLSTDNLKEALDNRINQAAKSVTAADPAKVAAEKAASSYSTQEEETPSLPGSNLNNFSTSN
jgi:polyhydroxyalkanoate synthesis repressor PhaR